MPFYQKKLVPLEKEVKRIDENREEIIKDASYKLQFINRARSVETSLSNLANNLSEGIHKIQCKYGHDDNKCEIYGMEFVRSIAIVFLNK